MDRLFTLLVMIVLLGGPLTPAVNATPRQALTPEQKCFFGTMYTQFLQVVDALPLLEAGVAELAGQAQPPAQLGECALWLGANRQSIGDWNGALDAYAIARAQFEARGDEQMIWTMWYGTASIYMAQGRFSEGRELLETKVLPGLEHTETWITPGLGALARGASYNNLGVVLGGMGEYPAAQEQLTLALQEIRAITATPPLQTTTGDAIDPHAALRLLRLSQSLAAGEKDLTDPAVLNEIAQFAQEFAPEPPTTGETPDDTLQELLDQLSGGTDASSPVTLVLVGQLLEWLQNPPDADNVTDMFPVDLGITQSLNELAYGVARSFEPMILNNQGEAARRQGDFPAAQGYYQEGLNSIDSSLAAGTTIPTNVFYEALRALIENNAGMAYENSGDDTHALESFYSAIRLMRRLNMRIMLASTLTNTGVIRQRRGETSAALMDFREAIDVLETTRIIADSNVTNFVATQGSSSSSAYALGGSLIQMTDIYNYAVQLSYYAAQQAAEPERTELLKDAFSYAERGRARLLLETLARSTIAQREPYIADLIETERRAYILLQMAQDTLAQARLIDPPSPLLPDLEEQAARAATQYTAARTALSSEDPRLLGLTGDQSGVLGVDDVQALLDAGTSLLVYYTFDERILPDEPALAFVLTKTRMQIIALPQANARALTVMRRDLSAWYRAQAGAARLGAPQAAQAHPRELRAMYDALIAPLGDAITTPLLGIVPHQALHYIPWAGLTDGSTYLADRAALFLIPSASMLAVVQENTHRNSSPRVGQALVFGDATLPPTITLPPLQHAGEEVQIIGAMLQTNSLTATQASEALFKANVAGKQVVHIAAHGVYSPTSVLDSAIYLAAGRGDDGLLRTSEVYGLDLRRADLVVLSACDTNVGAIPAGNVNAAAISTGDEILSQGRAFFSAGASSVLATLWQVDDASTAQLMVAFYQHWQGQGMSKAEAMRRAQADIRTAYPNPYFWAGFVLNGDPTQGSATLQLASTPTPTPVPTPIPASQPTVTPSMIVAVQPTLTSLPAETISAATPVVPAIVITPTVTAPVSGGLCAFSLLMVGLALMSVWRRR